ncbi:putative nucleoside phosphatase [Leishmania major strain Friedlin]|uniref:Putative nucleoside phosphatase n=1 Tax=Leishmania major TaxID=5664 RepID=Q4QHK3_LEIMA|nr:putative nucleoside phosphatase [Leishmania major strain Friedlin]CAG9569989.1 guanosine_diphosphatase_-_putative [Leishmania major strain Friedlin]CAJ02396.1 putative nucleoside phosphatase [Leishmania major strain Friedlin]|eukprot:XP_001681345.1 putative nucleoside phosphatase [Leishmania major strain Friedlin]
MSRVVLAFFAAVLFVVFLTAYEVGVGTANPLQSRHMQLTQNAVKKSEENLVNCREVNTDLRSGGDVNVARAMAEMRRQREELMNIVALERERVVSARSLLQVCEDELASDLSVLFGVADHNFTARLRSLEKKRKHLEGLHSMLNTDPFGAVQLRSSSEIRALQAALFHEMRASKKKAENGVASGAACAKSSVKYSVVFDIGSTGNRVHVYKYRVAPATRTAAAAGSELSDIDLVEELFELNHKALSELENSVQDAPEALWELFVKAKDFVPAELHACTAAEFKATAGLRMLGMEKANEILAGIRARYRNETFWLRGNASVRILDACEEGPMAWLTVNYLLGAFSRGATATDSTVAVIDLGGGSTQIVFEPGESTFHGMRTDFRYAATLGSRSVRAYQHSYEGYGLHAATKKLLYHIQGKSQEKPGGGTATNTAMTTTTTAPANGGDEVLPVWKALRNLGADGRSERGDIVTKRAPPMPPPDAEAMEAFPCFAVGYEDPLGVKNVKRNNAEEPVMPPNFQACANLFRDRLLKPVGLTCEAVNCGIAGVMQPPLTNFTGEIYAFSFIFDLLVLANSSLVPAGAAVSKEKFEVKLPDLAKIAEGHCAAFSLTRIAEATAKGGLGSLKPEYECMYYSYVYALLRYGYEVPEDRVLHVAKKIRGYETAWSLGASLLSLT